MKKLILLILMFCIVTPSYAITKKVHKWEAQISDFCSKYVSTEYSPWDLYNCLIEETREGYYWQSGYEQPVTADVIMPLSMYQEELVNASSSQKANTASYYQQNLPKMYLQKMNSRNNVNSKFTPEDVRRIWGR